MCGLRRSGEVWCWNMRLVCSPTAWIPVPEWERIDSTSDFVSFSAGHNHVCGLKQDGSLWCRGVPDFSSPSPSEPRYPTMTEVAPGTRWREVVASWYFTCGVQQDGSLWCWGDDSYGQLGLGFPANSRPSPERVGTDNDWHGLAANVQGAVCGAARRRGLVLGSGPRRYGAAAAPRKAARDRAALAQSSSAFLRLAVGRGPGRLRRLPRRLRRHELLVEPRAARVRVSTLWATAGSALEFEWGAAPDRRKRYGLSPPIREQQTAHSGVICGSGSEL
jgi:hypothetical protein